MTHTTHMMLLLTFVFDIEKACTYVSVHQFKNASTEKLGRSGISSAVQQINATVYFKVTFCLSGIIVHFSKYHIGSLWDEFLQTEVTLVQYILAYYNAICHY